VDFVLDVMFLFFDSAATTFAVAKVIDDQNQDLLRANVVDNFFFERR